ncbi:MAG: class F sortase [Patescibacteria group bacterium]|jgi:LPXTG-site transpeptidase (sortase) family protein
MQLSNLFKLSLFLTIIVGIVFFLVITFFLPPNPSSQDSVANSVVSVNDQVSQITAVNGPTKDIQAAVFTEQSEPLIFFHLSIPKIGVATAVESVGLTPQGAVDVPRDPANAAWFNLGPRPGESGSAVITGHYGRWKNGEGSVFDDLNKLSQGDNIYIEDEKGETTTFVVRESRKYDPTADAPEIFSSSDSKVHLNLITCEGTWNNEAQQYSERLVVFADKE